MAEQLGLFPVEPVVVVRVRASGEVEARWPTRDLCRVWPTWALALASLPDVCVFLGAPYLVRVRR